VPFVFSFETKLQFYKHWKYLVPTILVIASFYIAFDIYFTHLGVWGFNPRYHSSVHLFSLPVEEWLFFIAIPYASIFLHETFTFYFKDVSLTNRWANYISSFLIFVFSCIVIFNFDKAYTTYIFSLAIIALVFSFFDKTNCINGFYLTFLIILIPFVLVNAVLTGSFIDEPIVWYNNNENLGIRFLTIPIEDFGYAFSLILFNLLLRNELKNKRYGFQSI
jgi:lycopene cyclase domain-containing protein